MNKYEIKTALERCNSDDCDNCSYIRNAKCRDILIDAALNLITEQQQEIERLKAENEKRLTCDFVKTAQKQAKIDILNKAKEKLDSAPNGWAYTTYIDEMIEELQK